MKRYILNILCLIFGICSIWADTDTDVSQYSEIVYIESASAHAGEELALSVQLNNVNPVIGYNFKLYLPEGVTIKSEEDDWGDMVLDASLSGSRTTASRHTFETALASDGSVNVLCYSTKNNTFKGNSGEVASITVQIASSVQPGTYPVIIRNEAISLSGSTPQIAYIQSSLTILGSGGNDNVRDTIYVPVHDTTYINVPVHDTTYIDVLVHDTTYVDVLVHDTTYVDVLVHDTTYINVPVHDTTYIDVPVHDTTYIDVPVPVHDTTYIDIYDTIYVDRIDTVYLEMLSVNTADPTMGYTETLIRAIPEDGFRFLYWTDNDTSNPRIVDLSDGLPKSFTAVFANDSSTTDIIPVTVCDTFVCDFTKKATSNASYSNTWTYDADWNVTGGANNYGQWDYVKMGGRNSTANPVYVVNNATFDCEISSVKVTFQSGSFKSSGMSCNDWGVKVYSDLACTDLLYTTKGGTIDPNGCELTLTPDAGQNWAAGYAFQVYWDLTNTSSYNGVVYVSKIEFIPVVTPATPTDIETMTGESSAITRKILHNGQLLILRGDKTYTLTGQEVK